MNREPTTFYFFTKISRYIALSLFVTLYSTANSQIDTTITKGSYTSYPLPEIEDNSMLLDEAINQSAGFIQGVSSFVFEKGRSQYQLDVEIPLAGEKHQLSFSVPYFFESRVGEVNKIPSAPGDLSVGYRKELLDRTKWCLLTCGLTVQIPSGNCRKGFSEQNWSTEMKIAMTKRLHSAFTTHLNVSSLFAFKRKNPVQHNLGTSVVWAARPEFNIMLESVYSSGNELTINPAFRFSLKSGKSQVVPGVGFPLHFVENGLANQQILFYLSIEAGK